MLDATAKDPNETGDALDCHGVLAPGPDTGVVG